VCQYLLDHQQILDAGNDLYDLKRTAFPDAEDDRLTGHKTEAMKNRYRVKPEIVKPAK
jgi:hypothetical protein